VADNQHPTPASGPAPGHPAPGSVWLTGQTLSRQLRKGRYMPDAIKHPGKMLPTIARYAIHTYTSPGDVVLDPMAGIGTTVIEAMHLGRHGIGVEYEPRWADLAAANIRLAERHGATGSGIVYAGDARRVLPLLPDSIQGQAALVITSPPYGASVHGRAVTPGRSEGKVRRIHDSYGRDPGNLAHRSHGELAAGFTDILTACMALLRPGGHLLITARPYRRDGELIDIPGMVEAAGVHAGFDLVENCIALICAVQNGEAVRRASFFQQKNVREAIASGDPQWIVQHEDAVILKAPQSAQRDSASSGSAPGMAPAGNRLDAFTPSRMDRRPHPAPAANTAGGAAAPPAHPGRGAERTSDPCLPHPRPTSGPVRTVATGHRPSADHDTPPQPGQSHPAGQR